MFRGGAHAITSSHTSWYSTIYPSSIDLLTFFSCIVWFYFHSFAVFTYVFVDFAFTLSFCDDCVFVIALIACKLIWDSSQHVFSTTTKKVMPYNKRVFHGIATRAFSAPKKHDLYCIQNDCTRCTGSFETLLDLFLWFNWEKQKFNQEWARIKKTIQKQIKQQHFVV